MAVGFGGLGSSLDAFRWSGVGGSRMLLVSVNVEAQKQEITPSEGNLEESSITTCFVTY